MKIVAIIQARMGSTRLPGKVMKKMCGKTILFHVISRVQSCNLLDDIIVATTTSKIDDVIVEELARYGVQFFRGNEKNVLERYHDAATKFNADIVVRVTADNPLVDPNLMSNMLEDFLEKYSNNIRIDYLSNNLKKRTYPYGLDLEIMTTSCLKIAFENAESDFEKEHVTPYIREHPELFSLHHYSWDKDFSHYRWTVDTAEDYDLISQIFEALYQHNNYFRTNDVIELINIRPKLFSTNELSKAAQKDHIKFTLGTAQLGLNYGIANIYGQPSFGEAISIVQEAVSKGISSIDTARAYGNSETIIGLALKNQDIANKVEIITKLEPLIHLSEESALEEVRLAVDASIFRSCKELKSTQLDTVLLHKEEHIHNKKICQRLLELREEGYIQKLGVSVYTPEEAINALKIKFIEHIQIPFNLLDWRWRSSEFHASISQRLDVTVHARSIFLQGLLTADLLIWETISDIQLDYWKKNLEQIVSDFSRESIVDLCIAYVRAQSWIDSLVIGLESSEQLRENLRLFQLPPLTLEECKDIETRLPTFPEELLNPSNWRKHAQ